MHDNSGSTMNFGPHTNIIIIFIWVFTIIWIPSEHYNLFFFTFIIIIIVILIQNTLWRLFFRRRSRELIEITTKKMTIRTSTSRVITEGLKTYKKFSSNVDSPQIWYEKKKDLKIRIGFRIFVRSRKIARTCICVLFL